MQTKILGNSDLDITTIGFGAWAIGGDWKYGWGKQDDSDSIKTIHKALDTGINWIDTAAVYGLGRSETVVGKALKQTSTKPYIFTKCAMVWDDNKNVSYSLKKESLEKEIDASLSRLGVEQIDLYQIHWPVPDEDIEEGWETLNEIKESGKVRYIGVSNFSVKQMERAAAIAPLTSLQPPYNLVNRGIEENILSYCLKKSIGVIVYSPMASGMLSGKMTRERIENFEQADWRRGSEDYQEPKLSKNLAIQDKLIELGKKHNCTAGEVAIAWTLANPAVTGAIVGMRRPDQVDGVIHAGSIQLEPADIDALW
jgi:aryl-alcohol dehydrogenase-like predicted oxidoreductase